MNNVFNRLQMFETREDCNKFSKSVSYETLVGGTATIGREYKQTRRLFLSSADKPLSAVGTLTSLLCNSAKVVEKWLQTLRDLRSDNESEKNGKVEGCAGYRFFKTMRFLYKNLVDGLLQISPVLRLVKIFSLVAVLSVGMISESRAECHATENNQIKSCYDTWNPGEANNCGDGCTYTYNNGKLTVTATKPDAVISEGIFSTWYYEEKAGFPNITNIEIAGEFKTIGKYAFLNNGATISGKGGILYVNNIGRDAFGNNNTLTGTIIVSDKQTTLGEGPWYAAGLNATVILPPTLRLISASAVYGLKLGPNAKIYCGAENCEELFKNADCEGYYTDETLRTRCKNNLKTLLSSGKLLAYPDGCTKMGASGCIKCKSASFRLNDGECDRLRYTPAEAAEVLRDDDTNEIVITFRK